MTLAASVAQLAEQRFCKPPVVGSNPSAGLQMHHLLADESLAGMQLKQGRLPEWLKGADCKSADYVYIGSNPIPPTSKNIEESGNSKHR